MRAMRRAHLHPGMVRMRRWLSRAASVAVRCLRDVLRNHGTLRGRLGASDPPKALIGPLFTESCAADGRPAGYTAWHDRSPTFCFVGDYIAPRAWTSDRPRNRYEPRHRLRLYVQGSGWGRNPALVLCGPPAAGGQHGFTLRLHPAICGPSADLDALPRPRIDRARGALE